MISKLRFTGLGVILSFSLLTATLYAAGVTRISYGAANPTNCVAGNINIKTAATAGLYWCSTPGSPGVWTAVGGSGGTPGGSDKQIQYNNAGAFGGISPSTSGYVLTSTGVAGTPTFQAATSGALVLVEQHAATGTAVNFTSCISSTYDDYLFRLVSVIPTVDDSINVRYSTNAGVSWITTGTYYWGGVGATNASAVAWMVGSGDTKFELASSVESTTEGLSGGFTISGPAIGSNRRQGAWNVTTAAPTNIGGMQAWGVNTGTTAINAVQFIPNTNGTNTFAAGNIRCYGIAK